MSVMLVIGGCRSGKSSHALNLAGAIPGDRRIFMATCVPTDDEMKSRVLKHQAERPPGWITIETPTDLTDAIGRESVTASVILVDCLTLWASNLMVENRNIGTEIESMVQCLEQTACPVILVSGELGLGVVPENTLARSFRDVVGLINQHMAAVAQTVVWMVAGIPVVIKSKAAS
ncbi:MAG: bifunctional adenosylcobinamide kinase/adenosylcobinamide-phosphate guanylyltransferase [Desulfatirhabdiaceae bacterium]